MVLQPTGGMLILRLSRRFTYYECRLWETMLAAPGYALNDEQDFERLLETALPLVRPFVRRIKRKLPRNFEVDELENVAMNGLFAAARDYRALQDGKFVGYAVTRIRGAILNELRRLGRIAQT